MFCIQLRIAIMNLIDPPLVDNTYEKEITRNDMPLITICPNNQTNVAKLQEIGYKLTDKMMVGEMSKHLCSENSSCITSWGIHMNLTFKDIISIVYDKKMITSLWIKSEVKTVFLPMMGLCKEISSFKSSYQVPIYKAVDNDEMTMFVTDKSYRSYFLPDLSSHVGNKTIQNPARAQFFNVKVRIISSCTPKEIKFSNSDYIKCIEDKIENKIRKVLGCNPPWMSPENHCSNVYSKDSLDIIPNFFEKFAKPIFTFNNIKLEEECRKTCLTTKYFVNERGVLPAGMILHLIRKYWLQKELLIAAFSSLLLMLVVALDSG